MSEAADYFSSNSEGGVGVSWTNPSNALANDGNDATTTVQGTFFSPNDYTKTLTFYDWDSLSSISDTATISNIKIEVYGQSTAGTEVKYRALVDTGGNSKDITVNSEKTYTVGDGDLTYWGVTNQEALDAIKSTSSSAGIVILGYNTDGFTSYNLNIDYVYLTVTYTNPPSGGGFLLAK